MAELKICQTCIQVDHYFSSDGKECWDCENCFGSEGVPVHCEPPYNDACKNYTTDAKQKDKPQDELRYFVDHFWDEDGTAYNDDYCYECALYDDDYIYDDEADEIICRCGNCSFNEVNRDD